MNKSNKTILLDMDGVIFPFHEQVFRMYGEDLEKFLNHKNSDYPLKYAIEEWLSEIDGDGATITEEDMWKSIDDWDDFWVDCDPYKHARELITLIRDCGFSEIILSSSPGPHHKNAGKKVEWFRKHAHILGLDDDAYMMGKHKHLMSRSSAILIDDSDTNIVAFNQGDGLGIYFPQPWNRAHDLVDKRMAFIETTLRLAQ